MGKKLHAIPHWAQNLVNAQIEVNRAVHAMNMLNDPKHKDDYDKAQIKHHAEYAQFYLKAVLEKIK